MIISLSLRGLTRTFKLVLLLGSLLACASDDAMEGNITCPSVGILGGAEKIFQFKPGPGRDVIDVMFEGKIRNIAITCKYLAERIISEVQFELVATRGPSTLSEEGSFTYFVSVQDVSGRILAKETFNSVIAFGANKRRVGVLELTEQSIPIIGNVKPENFEILVGFQLSKDQFEYNRGQ